MKKSFKLVHKNSIDNREPSPIKIFSVFFTSIILLSLILSIFYRSVDFNAISSSSTVINTVELQRHRKLILESIDENEKSAPKLAWIVSFPNSGETDIISFIHNSTKKATASNYGHIMLNEYGRVIRGMFVSVPVFTMRTNGPFLSTHHLEMPNTFIPVVSHCGGYCDDCNPAMYFMKRDEFIGACAATIRFTPDIGLDGPTGNGFYENTKYTTAMVQKALVVMRNPFHTIQDRFLQFSHGFENDVFATRYKTTQNGFQNYCQEAAVKYADEEKKWFEFGDLDAIVSVPCHAEFYRWVQWYNLMFQSLDYLKMPYKIIHYDDFTATKNGTQKVIDFFELQQQQQDENYTHTFYYQDDRGFLSSKEQEQIMNMIKRFATDKTWAESMLYFNLGPNLLVEAV